MKARARLAIYLFILSIPLIADGDSISFTPTTIPGSPWGLNNSSQVVGIFLGGETTTAYLYSEGVATPIRLNIGPGPTSTFAYGINNTGALVGAVENVQAGNHGFLDVNGDITLLDDPGFVKTVARGINDRGQIVGYANDRTGAATGFVMTDGRWINMSVPGSFSTFAYRITDSGEIVGYSTDESGHDSGFVYRAGTYQTIEVPGSTDTLLFSANDAGQMVGSFVDNTGTHGFLYQDGVFTPFDAPDTLPTLGTFARDIDSSGNILVYGMGSGTFVATSGPPIVVPEPCLLTPVFLSAAVISSVFAARRRRFRSAKRSVPEIRPC